jgi:hypothetical protein
MIRIAIDFEPESGNLQIQVPNNLALALALLDRVRTRIVDQALAAVQPAVQEASASMLPRLNGYHGR